MTIDELIKKHGYVVSVKVDDEDELTLNVDFAGKKTANYKVIVDDEGNVYGITYKSSVMPEDSEETVLLDILVTRLYILCDIYRQCRELGLPYEIVRFVDGEEYVDFTNLLCLEMSPEQVETEQILEQCISRVLEDSIPFKNLSEALERDGILHLFNILRGLLI